MAAVVQSVDENRGYRLLLEALGPLGDILHKDDVVEVYCNSDCDNIWVEYLGRGRTKTSICLNAAKRRQIIEIVATFCKTIANQQNPIISAELPKYGYRFEGSLPNISIMPTFNIRKPAMVVFTLDDYVNQGIMSEKQKLVIQKAVRNKMNVLVGGGTGSGKTTLCNAILQEVGKTGDRLVIIEDTRELQCNAEDYESFRTSDDINTRALIRSTMRRRPDRIVVGEVRDGAAYDLLKAWNTGHPGGVSTTHANSALESLHRIEALSLESGGDGSVAPPISVISELIGNTVNLVVFIARSTSIIDGKVVKGRKIKELAMCRGFDNASGKYNLVYDEDEILEQLGMRSDL